MTFIPPVPPSKTSMQGAYDKNANILWDNTSKKSLYFRSSGIGADGAAMSLITLDTVGASPFATGLSFVHPTSGFTKGIPSLSCTQQIVNDTNVTFPSATSVEFGVDLVAAGGIASASTVILKSSDVAGDESIYGVASFSNGTTTNSIANLSTNYKTLAAPNITSTTGVAAFGLQGDTMGALNSSTAHYYATSFPVCDTNGSSRFFAGINQGGVLESSFHTSNQSGTMDYLFNGTNSGTLNFGTFKLTNNLGGVMGASMIDLANNENTGSANIRMLQMANLGDAADILWTSRSTDPSATTDGDTWYNDSEGRLKLVTNATTKSFAYTTDLDNAFYEATIATVGGDYATITDAVTAGFYRLLVIGDFTESVSVVVPGNETLYIHIVEGATATFSDGVNITTDNTNPSHVILEGEGQITYANTGAGALVVHGLAGNELIVRGNLAISNQSSSATTPLCNTGIVKIDGLFFVAPNYDQAGVTLKEVGSYANNLTVFGGGTSCSNAFLMATPTSTGVTKATNLVLQGTLSTSLLAPAMQCQNVFGQIDGLVNQTNAAITSRASLLTGVNDEAGGITLRIDNSEVTFSDSFINYGDLELTASSGNIAMTNVNAIGSLTLNGADRLKVSNCYIDTSFTIDGDNCQFSNIDCGAAITVSGLHNSMTNCRAETSMTISGDYNRLSNMQVGSTGSGTITLNAGADSNLISNSHTGVAIVDNGAGNGLANNLTF